MWALYMRLRSGQSRPRTKESAVLSEKMLEQLLPLHPLPPVPASGRHARVIDSGKYCRRARKRRVGIMASTRRALFQRSRSHGLNRSFFRTAGMVHLFRRAPFFFKYNMSCAYMRSTRPLAGGSLTHEHGAVPVSFVQYTDQCCAFWQGGLPLCARAWRLCSLEFCSTVSMVVKVVHCINRSIVYSRAKLTTMANSYASDDNCCRTPEYVFLFLQNSP